MGYDFEKHGIGVQDIQADIKQTEESQAQTQNQISKELKIILATRDKLKTLKETEISFSDPVLRQGDNPVIFPHTINVIQGQAGVHKSRLAETICAALLKRDECENELLGFERVGPNATHTVVYVDTERNLSEQLPYALQSIQMKAGYKREDHPVGFEYVSLLQINRKDRFVALTEYLTYIRKTVNNPLFVVLDVSTDCIEDFNKTDKSMELIDLMNMAINEHNVIFLCIIHENPRSDKARGHFGTELMNKASTVIQVGFEKDAKHNDTDLIRVKYLKCRTSARHASFYIKYSSEVGGLILADASEVSDMGNSREQKAKIEEVAEYLEICLGDGSAVTRVDLLDRLGKEFEASQRTIETRLSTMIKSETIIYDNDGSKCILSKRTEEKITYYELLPYTPL